MNDVLPRVEFSSWENVPNDVLSVAVGFLRGRNPTCA